MTRRGFVPVAEAASPRGKRRATDAEDASAVANDAASSSTTKRAPPPPPGPPPRTRVLPSAAAAIAANAGPARAAAPVVHFMRQYTGDGDVLAAWAALSSVERQPFLDAHAQERAALGDTAVKTTTATVPAAAPAAAPVADTESQRLLAVATALRLRARDAAQHPDSAAEVSGAAAYFSRRRLAAARTDLAAAWLGDIFAAPLPAPSTRPAGDDAENEALADDVAALVAAAVAEADAAEAAAEARRATRAEAQAEWLAAMAAAVAAPAAPVAAPAPFTVYHPNTIGPTRVRRVAGPVPYLPAADAVIVKL